ncbi:signal peptide-containing protein [Babesia ovata]|uniref:Signal peptide-containing protein n=1 Tax=Babesia ovata TaxID=189622 RepID=A0A2H6K861_9APIC|nr:signal peptide-containing protein [Babesia ovata]GBE59186.1 signal peptide-containing protein [Babesia ovata]
MLHWVIAGVTLLVSQWSTGYAFRRACDAPILRTLPALRAPLYGKNRHCDRMKRIRRDQYFYGRRRDLDALREPGGLEHAMSIQRHALSVVFGRPLSQRLGDGGVIPYLSDASDKAAHVREYFGIRSGEAGEVADLCASVARHPATPRGEFKGKPPMMERVFYREPSVPEEEAEFNRAADYQSGMAPLTPQLGANDREHRFYSGLWTEVVFRKLPKQLVDELKGMEIDAKQGRVDGSKLRRKTASFPGLSDPDDSGTSGTPPTPGE